MMYMAQIKDRREVSNTDDRKFEESFQETAESNNPAK